MGQMITPSPTPSIDELLPSLPPFVDEVDNAPAQNMNASRHGGWGYGTPPREEDALHSHESLLSSSHDASLVSVVLSFHQPR